MMTEQDKAEFIEIAMWERADPVRWRMIFEQKSATYMAAMRMHEFSWLPRSTLIAWARMDKSK